MDMTIQKDENQPVLKDRRHALNGFGGVFFSPVASLLQNWELFRRLLTRDIQSSVRGSVLGTAWIVVIPLVLVAIYTFVFGVVLNSVWASETRSKLEVPLIYFTGLMIFSFFMEVITRAPEYIRQNKTYVTKMIFPIEILDWVLVGTAAFKLVISFSLLVVFMVLLTGRIPAGILLVPLLILPFILLIVGLAWIISALGTFVRDFNHAVAALGPVFMFISPIFYSVEQVPEDFRFIYLINPLTFVLENMRGLLFFDGSISWAAYAVYWLVAALVFVGGFFFFERARPGFADVI